MTVPRTDIVHLLRRTEYVARQSRVDELCALADISAAVDNILDTGDPGVMPDGNGPGTEGDIVRRQTMWWLNRMAFDSPRPFAEKMAFFWHGYVFVSARSKVTYAWMMRDQIDLYRHHGLGNIGELATTMATQPAMLRYLDNDANKATSPNQNFGRELLELFLLGVGNYTEADVEASTAAWTGHTLNRETWQYWFREEWHETAPQTFLGRTINKRGRPETHGAQTIATILGDGTIPQDAANTANRGRPSRDVAAEHLTRKLWAYLAGGTPPKAVLEHLRDVLVTNNFEIRPWVRALLVHPAFYKTETRQGLLRSPVDWFVACMWHTNRRAGMPDADGVWPVPYWRLSAMGQVPYEPPNVSGWRHNAEWVTASSFAARQGAATTFGARCWAGSTTEGGDGLIRLPGGTISRTELEATHERGATEAEDAKRRRKIADRMIEMMRVELTPETTAAIRRYATNAKWWELRWVIVAVLMSPEVNAA